MSPVNIIRYIFGSSYWTTGKEHKRDPHAWMTHAKRNITSQWTRRLGHDSIIFIAVTVLQIVYRILPRKGTLISWGTKCIYVLPCIPSKFKHSSRKSFCNYTKRIWDFCFIIAIVYDFKYKADVYKTLYSFQWIS